MTPTAPSPNRPLSNPVVAIDHVGTAVPDLDAAIAWYAEHLEPADEAGHGHTGGGSFPVS